MHPVSNRYERLLAGDREAITSLYDILLPKLKSWIIANSGQTSDARDVLHEGLTSLIIAGHKKQTKVPDNVEAFVFTVCKYKWLDKIKKRKTAEKVTSEAFVRDIDSGDVQDRYIEMETDAIRYRVMERAFTKLSELCQRLLNLVKEGRKAKDIAEQMNMSGQSTVNRRKFACMDRWRKFVQEDQDYSLISKDQA